MTARDEWRDAVKKSGLSENVRDTLLAHATARGGYHNDDRNEHRSDRQRVASKAGASEASIKRRLGEGVAHGYMMLHNRGKIRRGAGAVYHYLLPGEQITCECNPPDPLSDPLSDPLNARPSKPLTDPLLTRLYKSERSSTDQPGTDPRSADQNEHRQDPSVVAAVFSQPADTATAGQTYAARQSRPLANLEAGQRQSGSGHRTVTMNPGGATFPLPFPSPVIICPDCGLTRKRLPERPGWQTHPACRPLADALAVVA